MNIKNFIIECGNCKNKGVLIDTNKFEIAGKYNGYPTLICKKCSRVNVYKVPIKYYLTKLGAIIFMASGIYEAFHNTSPMKALVFFSIVSGIIYMFGHKKEIEIIDVFDV